MDISNKDCDNSSMSNYGDSVSSVFAMKDGLNSMLQNLIHIRDNVTKLIENNKTSNNKNIYKSIEQGDESDVEIIDEIPNYAQTEVNMKRETPERSINSITNSFIDELYKITLLNLHPKVEYKEISHLMSELGFNDVEDIVLTNRSFSSTSVVSFTDEAMMLEALNLSGKIVHRNRIISVEQDNTNSKML